jgi:hypothetical protein
VFDADAFAGTGGGTEPTSCAGWRGGLSGLGGSGWAEDMKVCDATCLEGVGIRAAAVAECLVGEARSGLHSSTRTTCPGHIGSAKFQPLYEDTCHGIVSVSPR